MYVCMYVYSSMYVCMYVCIDVCMYVCIVTHIARVSVDQPGKVAIPARGQLNGENEFFPVRARA